MIKGEVLLKYEYALKDALSNELEAAI